LPFTRGVQEIMMSEKLQDKELASREPVRPT